MALDPNGSYLLSNVPVPAGAFRVRMVCEQAGETILEQTDFVIGVPLLIVMARDFDVLPALFVAGFVLDVLCWRGHPALIAPRLCVGRRSEYDAGSIMSLPKQLIRVGDQQIALPEGVTVSEWAT